MRFLDANTHYRNKYGAKVYRVAVSLDVTCPNRDGTKGTGGCIFCSAGGSGEFASKASQSITEQIDCGIELISSKIKGDAKYICYFQSFTSTYCQASYLREKLLAAASDPRIVAITIGTRPDCLSDDILDVLSEVNSLCEVSVELGLQTSNETTARLINRCYPLEVYDEAVKKLRLRGIEVVTHIILGLPNETTEDALNTVRHALSCGTNGLKFTCLYVASGTKLEELWRDDKYQEMSMDEYFAMLDACLEIVPSDIVIYRITGDCPKKILLAPMWTANKRAVINYINNKYK